MNPKAKKKIIILVSLFLAVVLFFVVQTILTSNSSVVINDLRIKEQVVADEGQTTNVDLLKKEVYLSSSEENNFNIFLDTGTATVNTKWTVSSSDTSVANVTEIKGSSKSFTINYFKTGKTVISAHPQGSDVIKDSFVLTVKENYPDTFKFIYLSDDDEAFSDSDYTKAENEDCVAVYADGKEYKVPFFAGHSDSLIINNDNLKVLSYNENIFENVEIDSQNSALIIKAKKDESNKQEDRKEIITIQSKISDGSFESFNVFVDVKGYYIYKLQLEVSETPNFNNETTYVMGEGPIGKNEKRIANTLYFLKPTDSNMTVVDSVYVRVRGVYTNSEMKYVTRSLANTRAGDQLYLDVGDINLSYIKIFAKGEQNYNCAFSYEGSEIEFVYYINTDYSGDYIKNFYEKIMDSNGNIYYEYSYWDTRFMRPDTVTVDGKIVGFTGNEPTDGYKVKPVYQKVFDSNNQFCYYEYIWEDESYRRTDEVKNDMGNITGFTNGEIDYPISSNVIPAQPSSEENNDESTDVNSEENNQGSSEENVDVNNEENSGENTEE